MIRKQLRTALMNSPRENENGIKRHVMNEEWVAQRDEAMKAGRLPKSGFTISERKIRSAVGNRLKTGDFEMLIAPRGDARARMRFEAPVGIVFCYGAGGEIEQRSTRLLQVVYSQKEGYHFFPVLEEE